MPSSFLHSNTCTHVRLLGPCFKTGRIRPFRRQRPWRIEQDTRPGDRRQSRRTARSPPHSTADHRDEAFALKKKGMHRKQNPRSTAGHTSRTYNSQGPKAYRPTLSRTFKPAINPRWRAPARSATVENPEDERLRSIRIRGPPDQSNHRLNLARHTASHIRFPFDGFTYFLTLFSKCFSSFPHGTCSLSVSCHYLALDGVYHPFWAAFPNNPTLRKRIMSSRHRHRRGCHPLRHTVPSNLDGAGSA